MEVERGSFVGLTFQAAWATATRGNPNTLISHQEAGGRQRQWAGLSLSLSYHLLSLQLLRPPPPAQATAFSRVQWREY